MLFLTSSVSVFLVLSPGPRSPFLLWCQQSPSKYHRSSEGSAKRTEVIDIEDSRHATASSPMTDLLVTGGRAIGDGRVDLGERVLGLCRHGWCYYWIDWVRLRSFNRWKEDQGGFRCECEEGGTRGEWALKEGVG